MKKQVSIALVATLSGAGLYASQGQQLTPKQREVQTALSEVTSQQIPNDVTRLIEQLAAPVVQRNLVSNNPVVNLAFTPDSMQLVSSHRSGERKLWDVSSGKLLQASHQADAIPWPTNRQHDSVVSPNGLLHVVDSQNLWDPVRLHNARGTFLCNLEGPIRKRYYVAEFSPDSKRLLAHGYNSNFECHLYLWDTESGRLLRDIRLDSTRMGPYPIPIPHFSLDSSMLLLFSERGCFCTDVATGESHAFCSSFHEVGISHSRRKALVLSPDRTTVAVIASPINTPQGTKFPVALVDVLELRKQLDQEIQKREQSKYRRELLKKAVMAALGAAAAALAMKLW